MLSAGQRRAALRPVAKLDQADLTFRHVPVEEITPELIAPASAEEEGPLIVGPNMFAVFTVKKYA